MGEKTEKATPKKRNDERKKGNVFLSKDAISVATLIVGVFVFRILFVREIEAISDFILYCLELAERHAEITAEVFHHSIWLAVQTIGPLLAACVAAAVAATFAQTRMLVSAEQIRPKLDRISPLQGFKRLFSMRSLVEALKNTIKIAILLILIYTCLQNMIELSVRYLYVDVVLACQHLLGEIFSMLLKVIIAFVALAAFDFGYQWWDYERQLKMSKQEIKEEYKQTEGDPQIKGKIKELQRKMAQARMMQQVPGADVIVRNPTHVAVALRYHADRDTAPVVLAKGADELAARIVQVAEENQIPVVENVAVARALYAGAELNREIPPDLYEAVAEVLVYLYKLGKMRV